MLRLIRNWWLTVLGFAALSLAVYVSVDGRQVLSAAERDSAREHQLIEAGSNGITRNELAIAAIESGGGSWWMIFIPQGLLILIAAGAFALDRQRMEPASL